MVELSNMPQGLICGHCGSDISPIELNLKHAEVLRVEPGDLVILKTERPLNEQDRDRIFVQWQRLFKGEAGSRVILLGKEDSISVLGNELH